MLVYKNPQRQWLAGAEQDLAQCKHQRLILDQRIAELEEVIRSLRAVVGNNEERADISLPKLCLQVLTFSGAQYQPVPNIREGLKAIGIDVPGQNPLAVLHTALGRLVENGLAESRSLKPGAPLVYRITTAGRLALQNQ